MTKKTHGLTQKGGQVNKDQVKHIRVARQSQRREENRKKDTETEAGTAEVLVHNKSTLCELVANKIQKREKKETVQKDVRFSVSLLCIRSIFIFLLFSAT